MESCLLLRLSSLGDVLFALGVVDRIREARPGAPISFLVEDRFAAVPRAHPGIDEVLVLPRREGARAVLRFLRGLRERRFDAVLDLQGNAKSSLVLAALRGSRKVGFAAGAGRDANFLLLDERVSPPAAARHRLDRFLALLPSLGIEAARAAPVALRLPEEARARAAELRAQAAGRPAVVAHPGTSAFGQFKRWEPSRFGRLAKQLALVPGAATFVSGGPGEESLVFEAAEASCGAALGLPPFPTLLHLAALLEEADLVVAADTGPLHLANRMGAPVLGLFGPKDPRRYGPAYAPSAVVQRRDVPCSPCERRWCEAPACMAGLGVEEVAFEARRLLTSSPARFPSRAR